MSRFGTKFNIVVILLTEAVQVVDIFPYIKISDNLLQSDIESLFTLFHLKNLKKEGY